MSANRESLRIRIALERVRTGNADHATLFCLVHTTLITEILCRSDSGDLPLVEITLTKARLAAMLEQGSSDLAYELPTELPFWLTAMVNEHDRQLARMRLGEIIEGGVCAAITSCLLKLSSLDGGWFIGSRSALVQHVHALSLAHLRAIDRQ